MWPPLTLAGLATCLTTLALTAQPRIHPDEMELKPKIDAAIGLGVETLLNTQLRDGSWGVHGNYVGGRAGLCAYALLKSGMQMDHPALRRAFAYLDGVQPNQTYSTACMMLAYGATGNPKHQARLKQLLKRMLKWQLPAGSWGYPHGAADLSNTQYAALGLWVAAKAGLKVPAKAWNELIDATLRHQEVFHYVDVKVSKRTGVGKLEVAGFRYRAGPKRNKYNPKPAKGHMKASGSMTTAGVSILKICEIGLGKRLKSAARQRLTHALEAGVNWLHANFSVTQNPGKGRGWLLYYLYGMERVGSLTRKEQFGDRWWYVEGARYLLKAQKKGSWGAETDNCFALLFLRRATNIGRPTTGGGAGSSSRHLFAAGSSVDDIALRGAGQQPLAIYINGFGKRLLAEHSVYGLRILRVDYLEGKRKIGELSGDPTKAWKTDTFLNRSTLSRGPHTIVAHVIALASNARNGDTENTVTIKSKPMKVTIRDVLEPWMESFAKIQAGNLLKNARVKVIASSNPKEAQKVVDGNNATFWLCDPKDARPTLTLVFSRTIKARRLMLTQALQRDADLGRIGVITAVEVAWNKSKRFERIELHEDPLAPTEFVFPKTRVLRRMTLRVVGRKGRPGLRLGLAEVSLAGKR